MTKIEKLEALTKGIRGAVSGGESSDAVLMSESKTKVKKITMEKVRKIMSPLTRGEGSELESQGSSEGAGASLDTAVEKLRNVTGNFAKAKVDLMVPKHERKSYRAERKQLGSKMKAPKAQTSNYQEVGGQKFYDPSKVSRRKLSTKAPKLPKSEGKPEDLEKQPPAADSPMGQMFGSIRSAFGGGQQKQAAPAPQTPPPSPPPQPKNPWSNLAGLGKGPLPDDGMSFKDMKDMEKQQGGITVPLTSMKQALGGKGAVTSKPKTPTTTPTTTTPTTTTTSNSSWASLGQRMSGKK